MELSTNQLFLKKFTRHQPLWETFHEVNLHVKYEGIASNKLAKYHQYTIQSITKRQHDTIQWISKSHQKINQKIQALKV